MTVAVLWKVRKQYPQMCLPYELVEIILRHVQQHETTAHSVSFI
jgi:hypothetical protein